MAEKKLGHHPGGSDHEQKKVDLDTPRPPSDLEDLEGVPSAGELHMWIQSGYTRAEIEKTLSSSSEGKKYETRESGASVAEQENKKSGGKATSFLSVDLFEETIKVPTGIPEEKRKVEEGKVTIGRFELRKKIGSGAMSTVHEAYDTRLERTVAMKIIHPDQIDQHSLERMVKEARVMAKLNDKNISAVYEMGYYLNDREEPELFFIMPLYAKSYDKKTVKEVGKMKKNEKNAFIRNGLLGLAEGLQKLHEKGFLHHDIKPENVFMDEYGHLKLSDFGLVEELEDAKESKRMKGTPHFFSPEKASIHPGEETSLDERSDWFSFAATCYTILTGGKLLFPKIKTAMELIAAINNYADSEDVPFQTKKKREWEMAMKNHQVPKHFRSFLLELLNADPASRIAATEVLSAFKKATEKDDEEMKKLQATGKRLREKEREKRKVKGYKIGA